MKKLIVLLVVVFGVGTLAFAGGPWISASAFYALPVQEQFTVYGHPLSVSASGLGLSSQLGFGIPLPISFPTDIDVYTGFTVITLGARATIGNPYSWDYVDTGWISFTNANWVVGTDLRWQSGRNFLKLGVNYAPPTAVSFVLNFYYEFSLPTTSAK